MNELYRTELVIQTWEDRYANMFNPAINANAATIKKIIGALSSHNSIRRGGFALSYLFLRYQHQYYNGNTSRQTHIFDFRHVIPSKLLTPEETLNTSDMNQHKFTTFHTVLSGFIAKDVWRTVAVTLEKNVAIVVMLRYRVVALSFSSARNIGSAEKGRIRLC